MNLALVIATIRLVDLLSAPNIIATMGRGIGEEECKAAPCLTRRMVCYVICTEHFEIGWVWLDLPKKTFIHVLPPITSLVLHRRFELQPHSSRPLIKEPAIHDVRETVHQEQTGRRPCYCPYAAEHSGHRANHPDVSFTSSHDPNNHRRRWYDPQPLLQMRLWNVRLCSPLLFICF